MRYILIISFICLISCKAQHDAKTMATENGDMELIAADDYSGVLDYEASIISDTKALRKFYSRINKTRKPGLPVPDVDFSKNMILAVCTGEHKGEKEPLLRKTEEENNVLITIELNENRDASKSRKTLTVYPFYLYKLPITPKTVSIQKLGF